MAIAERRDVQRNKARYRFHVRKWQDLKLSGQVDLAINWTLAYRCVDKEWTCEKVFSLTTFTHPGQPLLVTTAMAVAAQQAEQSASQGIQPCTPRDTTL